MSPDAAADPRREQLLRGLTRTQDRVVDAARAAGRRPSDVTLVVVTKFFPSSDLRLLAELGVRDIGESRHQEAADKVQECGGLGLTWHFIGNLQRNKAAAVASYADVLHSLDRESLVAPLARGALEAGRTVDVLLQVQLDAGAPPGRGGTLPAELPALADLVLASDGLRLRGVMAVAPLGGDPAAAFADLAECSQVVRGHDASATWISAGMSGDLEAAIEAGATHVRVGSAILGTRVQHR